tara:strand:- start:1309 stop:2709 length:1401 start_codon:yes stop_codon:yes gene_type:complete
MARYSKPRKNSKRIDPRYFLDETADRDNLREEVDPKSLRSRIAGVDDELGLNVDDPPAAATTPKTKQLSTPPPAEKTAPAAPPASTTATSAVRKRLKPKLRDVNPNSAEDRIALLKLQKPHLRGKSDKELRAIDAKNQRMKGMDETVDKDEKEIKKITGELEKASDMHQGQADRLGNMVNEYGDMDSDADLDEALKAFRQMQGLKEQAIKGLSRKEIIDKHTAGDFGGTPLRNLLKKQRNQQGKQVEITPDAMKLQKKQNLEEQEEEEDPPVQLQTGTPTPEDTSRMAEVGPGPRKKKREKREADIKKGGGWAAATRNQGEVSNAANWDTARKNQGAVQWANPSIRESFSYKLEEATQRSVLKLASDVVDILRWQENPQTVMNIFDIAYGALFPDQGAGAGDMPAGSGADEEGRGEAASAKRIGFTIAEDTFPALESIVAEELAFMRETLATDADDHDLPQALDEQ